jgi:hypothetical protein
MKKKVGIIRALSQKGRKPVRSVVPRRTDPPPKINVQPNQDDDQWQRDIAILRRAAEDLARRRSEQGIDARLFADQVDRTAAVSLIAQRRSEFGINGRVCADQFDRTAASVIESSDQQRPTIIRELYNLDPERAASYLNMVLQEATQEERQQIGAALQKSGLIDDAIENLTGSNHSNSYRAFSLLFLIAKAGTFEPLMRVIEDHPNIELRLALIRLLGTSGAPGLPRQLKRLLAKNSMPAQLSLAIREVTMQLAETPRDVASSAA